MPEQLYMVKYAQVADVPPGEPGPPSGEPTPPPDTVPEGVNLTLVPMEPDHRDEFRFSLGPLWFADRATADAQGFKVGSVVKVECTVQTPGL